MRAMALPNVWHLRAVAESASKSCYVCYKSTTAVLITPDNKDFFYVCRGHLKDRGFCSPIVDEAEVAAKQKKERLDKEIESIKKEYEEKMKKREKSKEKEQGKEEDKKQKQDADEDKQAEKEKDEKIKAATEKQNTTSTETDIPRIYSLHRNFYQMRLDRLRNAEIARRNKERLSNPSTFPSVPNGNP